MISINYSELRKDLKKNLDLTSDSHETLVVHRPHGKSVVVISLEDYNGYEETSYLLSSPANAKRLYNSMQQLSNGQTISHDPTV